MPTADPRPNILLIMTDQQSGSAMGCAGNADVQTPAMDSLAAEGTRFDRAYCQFPLCLPARTAIFTGQLPSQLGITSNAGALTEEQAAATLTRRLAAAGYTCGYTGKVHLPVVPGRTLSETYGWETLCGWDDRIVADACIEFLERDHDAPFFLMASYDDPHNICEWARHQSLPYGDIPDVPTPECPNLPANFAIPPQEPVCIRRAVSQLSSIHPTIGWTPEDWRHYRHAYYRLIERVDGYIGRILATLRARGLADNTLVIFTSDHGDGHGAHQLNQKSFLYDEIVRVPFIVKPPGGQAGRVARQLVHASTDILPTVLDYAGITAPASGPVGASVRPVVQGEAPGDWRASAYCETMIQGDGGPGRMIRSDRYTYIVYLWGKYREQLFDMQADPGQMVNLAVESRHAPILAAHRDMLADYCRATGQSLDLRWGIPV